MKMIAFAALAVLLSLLPTCEDRKFEFTGALNIDRTYEVDQTGAFDEISLITREDVLDGLDLPDDAKIRIKEVVIEGMALQVVKKTGNQATSAKVSGWITVGGNRKKMFENYTLSFSGVDVPFIGLNALIAAGVDLLKLQINNYIQYTNITDPIQIQLTGDSVPPGQRINLDIVFKLKAAVKYDECVSAASSVGEDCDID